ncbi:MAG: FimB/Mfa2 family fimbrial subunit [Paraprevotella sp.]|nr:FimB/Mfa2 family fimbrial subunit [Paraprevotella sp.]
MRLKTNIKKSALRVATAVMALLPLVAFTSCDDFFSEQEGDCSVTYTLKFRYDRNLHWADAFANEVSSVHAYAFDKSGMLVWHREEQVDQATADNYSMLLDLPAGDYKILAWCGLRNDGAREESFSVPEATIGETRIEDLHCSLRRYYGEAGAYSDKRLYRLFHGILDVSLPDNEDGGHYVYTVPLTKNTNHIRVILNHLSGEDVDVDKFTFRIDDENGLMAYHNGLLEDENINYRPWATTNGVVGLGKEDLDTRAIIDVKGAIADMTVARMMEDHRRKMMLTITNDKGIKVARIPVIDYALLAKGYYEEEYGHKMTDQEFLDREDDYVLTFFLDENNEWISSQILIHSWMVVPNEVDL